MKVNSILQFLWGFLFVTFVAGHLSNVDKLYEKSIVHEDFIIPVTKGDVSLVSGPRDYYTLMVFTSTDEKHGCELCVTLKDILPQVSKAWFRDNAHLNRLFFLYVDIVDATNFPLLKELNINAVPHIWLIPPNLEADKSDKLSVFKDSRFVFKVPLTSQQEQVKELAKFLREIMHIDVKVDETDPKVRFLQAFIFTLSIIIFIKKKGPKVSKLDGKKVGYTIFCIVLVLIFVSGYLFTTMRGVPFVAKGDKNNIIVISGGTAYQFGIEIIIVGLTYGSLAATLVTLIYVGMYEVTPTSKISDDRVKFLLICVINLTLYLLYSLLTSIYLRKDHHYPYAFTKLI